ncbi:hypothetical protein C6990_05395 [Nitrosopumilus sp. b3]|uniref:hypothetical protein n=1 Tax=Nitrosopumilus sp. b3 TaxID=2109909 RepID=UPI0015F71AB8|nr:hypothetical protein [Nitrosopumilus sp. b3]KAF6247116.1 hypothetical protein C6990_05395 [Nitrosopumilus sp. b3]
MYNIAKKGANKDEQDDLELIESVTKPFFDPYTESRQLFTQWMIDSDIYISATNFDKDNFLKRFVKQRDKVQTEFDKIKPNSNKLAEKVGELKIHLDALERHGTRKAVISSIKQKSTPQLEDTIILEKGKTVDILKQVSEIFNGSARFLKVMDKWAGVKMLDYFVSVPEIPIKILTSNLEKKSEIEFQVMLNRINETRSNKIEVRVCDPKEFHDRYIINEKDLWMIGSSLKDVGYKNWTTITRTNDNEKRGDINNIFDDLWKKSSVFSF